MPKRRAYSYVRFSTSIQADGGSLARQTRLTAEYCKRAGLTLDESLTLRDLGVSAFRGDNMREGALAGFLEACRMGRVPSGSVLIVESLDRLSRDQIRPALQLFLALQDYGITIVTHEPFREYDPKATDALALIEPLIVFARAHEESAMKSHRRRDGWNQAKERARQGGVPMLKAGPAWLKVTPDGFKVLEKKADAVRLIYSLACEGHGVKRITEELVNRGIPPIVEGDGRRWVKAYVYRILRSPAPMGTYQPNKVQGKHVVPDGEPIPNYYPAILDEQTWNRAQAAVHSRAADHDANGRFVRGGKASKRAGRHGNGVPNLFTGLLNCAINRERLHIVCAAGRKKEGEPRKLYRYLCPTRETGKTFGDRFDLSIFETAILSKLQELKPGDILGTTPKNDKEAEIARLSGRLLDIDSKLERARQRARNAEDFDSFLDLISDLQADRKKEAAALASLRSEETQPASANLGETQSLIDLLSRVSPEERIDVRRRLKLRLQSMLESIWAVITAKNRMNRFMAVQLFFKDGWHRSYLIFHRAKVQKWGVYSFADTIGPDDFDLRKKKDAAKLVKLLESIDLTAIQ